MKFDSLIVSISLEVRCNLCLAILIFYGNDITEKLRLNYIYFVLFNSNSNNIRIQQLEVHLYDLWSLWWVNKLVFLIYYLSPFYLDLISFYLILFPFSNYFSSIASYYISETNIWRLSLGAKERGLGDDSGWKYEIWDKNMSLPKSETWHGPCHQQHGRASLQDTHLLLLLHGQATYQFTSDLKYRGFLWNILVIYFLGLKSL